MGCLTLGGFRINFFVYFYVRGRHAPEHGTRAVYVIGGGKSQKAPTPL